MNELLDTALLLLAFLLFVCMLLVYIYIIIFLTKGIYDSIKPFFNYIKLRKEHDNN